MDDVKSQMSEIRILADVVKQIQSNATNVRTINDEPALEDQ